MDEWQVYKANDEKSKIMTAIVTITIIIYMEMEQNGMGWMDELMEIWHDQQYQKQMLKFIGIQDHHHHV